ncbi:Armadillo-like helical [Cinara cedri]|uniref:Armadillo-like helical n=1 Tax=Cinara cedri TaxID=506608 RepID=A0A5E4MZ45_9HEMI|nr:Armadillo-like helical [Cinara cedri]
MAVPFDFDEIHPEGNHFTVIQNLLREMLTLLRWLPWTASGNPLPNSTLDNPFVPPYLIQDFPVIQRLMEGVERVRQQVEREDLREQQHQIHLERLRQLRQRAHQIRQQERQQEREQRRQQQQPGFLPDLVASSVAIPGPAPRLEPDLIRRPERQPAPEPQPEPEPAPAPAPAPDPVPRSPPQPRGAYRRKKHVKVESVRIQMCPSCSLNGGTFTAIINTLSTDQQREPTFDDDDEEDGYCWEIKRRLKSLFQPSNIDSSILTAAMVIIGWKMFIKQ